MRSLYLLGTILMIGYASVFTLLAELRNQFDLSVAGVGLIAAVAFIAGFVAQISLARFADSGHGGRLMRMGMACALVGSIWMCFAESLAAWLAARFVLGFGAGAIRPAIRRLAFVRAPGKAGETLGKLAAWEMAGFLIGPVVASGLFELAGIRAPFVFVVVLLIAITPFVLRVDVPGSESPMPRAMRTLIRRPAMQSCLAMGVAFFIAIGVFDAIWAVFISDLGASQMFIGISMTLFTLPMILIAPWAGSFASRRNALNVVTVTMSIALAAMISYGYLTSIWWMCVPLIFHAVCDAISMPATQLAVGYASGESALAAGQGLFGATGLVVAAVASTLSGILYEELGAAPLWWVAAGAMAACIVFAQWRGKNVNWSMQEDPVAH